MSRYCIVKECNAKCTRFQLPEHEGQRTIWLQRSGNESVDVEKRRHWRICPRHFARQTFLKVDGDEGKLLKKLALPSLFMPDYTPKGEVIDSFLFSTKVEKPTEDTIPKIIKDIMEKFSTGKNHSPIGKVKTPIETYELKLRESDAIPSTSTECKEEMLEGINSLPCVEPHWEIMEDIEIKVESLTDYQCLTEDPSSTDAESVMEAQSSTEAQSSMEAPFSISSKKLLSRRKIHSFFKEAGSETRGDFYKIMAFIRNVKEKKLDQQHDLKYFVQLITEREELLNILGKYSEVSLNFFASNLQNFRTKLKGRKFSQEDKSFALSLYKQNAHAYHFLSKFFSLPSQNSLNQIINKAPSGINEKIIKRLKIQVGKLKEDRYCVLMFDEISLQPHLNYNLKTHSVDGFVDLGIGRRRLQFADRALVFMVTGIRKPWKQPIYFRFCEGTTPTVDLVHCIKMIIGELQAIDIVVVATVCDQGATKQAAINQLVGSNPTGPLIYSIGDYAQEIVHLYDPPHLLKEIRNELLSKDLQYEMNGSKKVARWSHIVRLYEIDQMEGPYKLCIKLTDEHVVPDKINKMEVSFASQVFSNTLGAAMYFRVRSVVDYDVQPLSPRYITPQAQDTVDLVMFFDKLFDSVNGEVRYPPHCKPLLGAVMRSTDHERFWLSAISTLSSMSFVTERPVQALRNWIFTLHGFCFLRDDLLLLMYYFFPRRFNQEPLENWFSEIRSQATGNFNCSSFINSFDSFLTSSFSSSHSVDASYEEDVSTDPLRTFVEGQDQFQYLEVEGDILSSNVPEAFCLYFATDHVAGTVIEEFIRNFPCNSCEELLHSSEEHLLAIKCEEHHLVYPVFTNVFKQVTASILGIISSIIHKYGVKGIILSELKKKNFTFLLCDEHKGDRQDHLLNIIINIVFLNYIEEVNRVLNGIDMKVINGDVLFQMAQNKYLNAVRKEIMG